ncbi:hypothetical protein B0H14DRAFT_2645592 [Mycena olivaceomarginata]|nr:hypothetical protein B0H14DRAFT_2645592 [Mycena olivaceomarginata]
MICFISTSMRCSCRGIRSQVKAKARKTEYVKPGGVYDKVRELEHTSETISPKKIPGEFLVSACNSKTVQKAIWENYPTPISTLPCLSDTSENVLIVSAPLLTKEQQALVGPPQMARHNLKWPGITLFMVDFLHGIRPMPFLLLCCSTSYLPLSRVYKHIKQVLAEGLAAQPILDFGGLWFTVAVKEGSNEGICSSWSKPCCQLQEPKGATRILGTQLSLPANDSTYESHNTSKDALRKVLLAHMHRLTSRGRQVFANHRYHLYTCGVTFECSLLDSVPIPAQRSVMPCPANHRPSTKIFKTGCPPLNAHVSTMPMIAHHIIRFTYQNAQITHTTKPISSSLTNGDPFQTAAQQDNSRKTVRSYTLSYISVRMALIVTSEVGSISLEISPVPSYTDFMRVMFNSSKFTIQLGQSHNIVATIMPSKEGNATTFPVYSGFIFITSGTDLVHATYLGVAASLKMATDLVPSIQLVFANIWIGGSLHLGTKYKWTNIPVPKQLNSHSCRIIAYFTLTYWFKKECFPPPKSTAA